MPNREQMFMYKGDWMSLPQIQKIKAKKEVKKGVIIHNEVIGDTEKDSSGEVDTNTQEETLEALTAKYKDKIGKLPPVNKKNDINWIKNKLNN